VGRPERYGLSEWAEASVESIAAIGHAGRGSDAPPSFCLPELPPHARQLHRFIHVNRTDWNFVVQRATDICRSKPMIPAGFRQSPRVATDKLNGIYHAGPGSQAIGATHLCRPRCVCGERPALGCHGFLTQPMTDADRSTVDWSSRLNRLRSARRSRDEHARHRGGRPGVEIPVEASTVPTAGRLACGNVARTRGQPPESSIFQYSTARPQIPGPHSVQSVHRVSVSTRRPVSMG